jgi:carbon storage regulator
MLVLRRKKFESVVVGDHLVTVTVVAIEGDSVRLGFTADRSIPVHRGEVQHELDGERRRQARRFSRPPDTPLGRHRRAHEEPLS